VPVRYARLLLVLPGWLAFMLYLPALTHGFVWDDNYFLTELPYLRVPELWLPQLFEPLFVSRNYFRPLPLLSFVVEARLSELDPFVFHLTNLLLHAANTTLVVLLVRAAIPAGVAAATGAGLLFAVHPALVENVAWISDRFDLLLVFFILLALVCESRIRRPQLRVAVVGGAFLLALLCKESAVVLLVLLPLWQMLRHSADTAWRPWRRNAWTRGDLAVWLALLLALAAYLALRFVALGGFYQSDSEMARGSGLQHLLLIGKTVGWYAVLAFWPFGQLAPVHPAPTPVALGDAAAWLGLAGMFVVGSALAYALVHLPQARRPAFAALMALVALSPVANLVPLTIGDNLVHDRYLILSIGFLALSLALAWEAAGQRRIATLLAGVWAVAAALTVVALVPHWQSNLTLWRWAYETEPTSRIARETYVAALVNAQRFEETVAVARQALAVNPDGASTTHNLALALVQLGNDAEGELMARRAILQYQELYESDKARMFGRKERMDISEAYNLLGFIQLRQGRLDEAEQALRQSIELTPYLTRPHFNLALVHYQRGEWTAGDRELDFAARYATPDDRIAYLRFGGEKKHAMKEALDRHGKDG
jgi:protein O-mannosyl-transferase